MPCMPTINFHAYWRTTLSRLQRNNCQEMGSGIGNSHFAYFSEPVGTSALTPGQPSLYRTLPNEEDAALELKRMGHKNTYLGAKIIIFSFFIIDVNDGLLFLSSIVGVVLFATAVFMRNFLPLPPEKTEEFADQFFDSAMFFLEFIICFSSLYSKYDLRKTYQYAMLAPLIGIVACRIKIASEAKPAPTEIKNEEEALEYIRKIVNLCLMQEEYKSLVGLSGILSAHFRQCGRADCRCEKLLQQLRDQFLYIPVLEENSIAYENRESIPPAFRKSWKAKTLKALLFELKSMHSNSALQLALAEIEFYFLGNYYQALNHI